MSSTHSSTSHAGSSEVKDAGKAIKGLFAGIHGAGEKIRGSVNEGVDGVFHEDQGVRKNSAIAAEGDREMATGKFSTTTKNREGALPGSDGGVRR